MKIIPQKNNLLIRMENLPLHGKDNILLPDEAKEQPYGIIIELGPKCELEYKIGDKILFLPGNMIGFDEHCDPRFIIPETVVLAKIVPDQNQDGTEIPNN